MATVSEINQTSAYQGNAANGGSLGIGITIDPAPVQRLATFSYYANRDKWEQTQKDNAAAANKIASLTAFDITSPLKPYSEDLKKSLGDIQKYIVDNPDSLTYSKSPEKYQQRETMINSFLNKRKAATANDALYNAAKTQVDLIPDPKSKDIEQQKLDSRVNKLFAGGLENAYNQQFEASPPPQPIANIIPNALDSSTVREVFVKLPNDNVQTKVSYIDPDTLMAQSELRLATNKQTDIKLEPWFQKLSPEDQKIKLQENALSASQRSDIEKTAADATALMQEWMKANPGVDIDTVDVDSLPNDTFGNMVRWQRMHNKDIDQLNGYVVQGAITDPSTGKIRVQPYSKVNLKDGISGAEMIFMNSLQSSKKPLIQSVDKTVAHTGDQVGIQKEREGNASRERIAKMDDLRARYIANLPYEKQKAGAVGADGDPLDFGNIIYGVNTPSSEPNGTDIFKKDGTKLSNVVINNGVITDQKGNIVDYSGEVRLPIKYFDNSIVTEFDKYAKSIGGTGKTVTKVDANGTTTTETSPDQVAPRLNIDKGFLKVSMKNGEIQGIETSDGTFASANLFQNITIKEGQRAATKIKRPNTDLGKFTTGSKPKGLKEEGNIDLSQQPSVKNPYTGGNSTVWSMSIGTDKGEVLISRVTPEGKVMSEKEAIDYYNKTGKNLGTFDTPEAATKYAQQLHKDYEDGKIKAQPDKKVIDLRKKYDY